MSIVNLSETEFSDKFHFSLIIFYIRKHKLLFYTIILMLILNVSLAMAGPLVFNYILEIVEQGIGAEEFNRSVRYAVIAYVGFSLLSWLFAAIQFVFVAKLNARFIRDLRIDAYSAILNNKVAFYDTQKTGDLTSRVVNDTRELSDSAMGIAWVFTSLFRLILVVAIFFYYSLYIASAALAFLPVIILIAVLLGRYERKVSKIWRERFGEVNARFQEIMSKIQISKAFHREQENLDRFEQINEQTFKASVKRGFAIFIFWPMTDLLKHLLLLLILAVGTWEVERGMPIATLVLFLILINYYYWPLITIANNYHRFQGAFASLERISKIAFDPKLKERSTDKFTTDINGHILFDNVTFGYNLETPVLSDLNFEILPGERVALVGHTGAGKSTIASLLMRFYPVSSGKIFIDGTAIDQFNLTEYRKQISLVSQRVLLFKGTIRENLQVSSPEATDEEIWEVLDMVQSREFIELLPEGLDTVVEENGKNLSAGQKQMISFARALLSDPQVIILDEATSAVDLYTEAKIQDAIDVLLSERTSISIAHRLTTILKSDKIIVLDQGRIVQIGDHDELLNQGGLYADMYHLYLETQSAKYLETIKR